MGALTPRVVRTARGAIEVAETGAGPVLLVVHGMPGDWRQARPLAEDLCGSARLLLVSRPGYGRTPLSSGRTPVDQAALYAALLDELGHADAAVVGISGGGPSAYAFAALHPDRCRSLLLCCALRGDVMTAPAAMRRLAAVPGVWQVVAGAARALGTVRRRLGPLPETALTSFTPAERERLMQPGVLAALRVFENERLATLSGRGLRNDTLNLGQPVPAWPAGVTTPTEVLHGDLDDVVPVRHAAAYAELVPHAEVTVLPGLGHGVPVFARDELAELVRQRL